MCGIVGVHCTGSQQLIFKMNEMQYHRGPDGGGVSHFNDLDFSFGMRRLAIVDIDGGIQPISDGNQFSLVYNGEIFNNLGLRAQLAAKGIKFISDHSDTELLFRLLVSDGLESLAKLNGFFSFAFLDQRRRKLFLSRDRYGIKPLYFTNCNGNFAFASEIKALTRLPFVSLGIDKNSVSDYFSLQYIKGPKTIYQEIVNLPAGTLLTYDFDSCSYSLEKWWKPKLEPDNSIKIADATEAIRVSLEQAVIKWTSSDVPLCASLSGGLDSTAIVAFASRAGIDLSTYSLGFEGEQYRKLNELSLARQFASDYNTNHTEIILRPADVLSNIEGIVYSLEQPYSGGIPSWFVYLAASSSHKVILTGVGGDELFGNYGKFRKLLPKTLFGSGFLARLSNGNTRQVSDSIHSLLYMGDEFKERYMYPDYIESYSAEAACRNDLLSTSVSDLRDKIFLMDMSSQLVDEFLFMTDRFSMSHSLEARTPFLDTDLVDLTLRIPTSIRAPVHDPKLLLRKALAGVVPSYILRARKKGFIVPLECWLRHELSPLVYQYLSRPSLANAGVLKPSFYSDIVLPHMAGTVDNSSTIFTALMYHMWYNIVFQERK